MAEVLISGGTGLVGTNLTSHLLRQGYEVTILVREKNKISDKKGLRYSYWSVKDKIIDPAVINRATHVIHLAGAGVMDHRWTNDYKNEIINSRVVSASLIIDTIKNNLHKIKSFVSASAIGWYGEDGRSKKDTKKFVESDPPADDFLGNTCVKWEACIRPVKDLGIRPVSLRTGIVLSNEGGAFTEFQRSIPFGVAAILGSGRQVISWIHIDDLSRMYIDAIENNFLEGSYNAVAPEPVSNKNLMLMLAQKLRNRFYIPMHVPKFLLKTLMGERSTEILKSATVSSKKIRDAGFTFLYPGIEAALDELVKEKKEK